MTYYSLDVTQMNIIWPAFMQGIGLGLVFVPLSTVAYATLDSRRMAEAAGLYSLGAHHRLRHWHFHCHHAAGTPVAGAVE